MLTAKEARENADIKNGNKNITCIEDIFAQIQQASSNGKFAIWIPIEHMKMVFPYNELNKLGYDVEPNIVWDDCTPSYYVGW